MRSNPLAIAFLLILTVLPSQASDNCAANVIRATADVSVSDGPGFSIESFFGGVDEAAIRFVDDNEQVIAVEGSWAWVSQNGAAQLGEDAHKVFALGHQFHALLLYFERLAIGVRQGSGISFGEVDRAAISGDYPYGGTMHLITGDDWRNPEGFVFDFPESPRIEVHFSDWRTLDDTVVPFRLQIDDGDRVFDYHYTEIDISQGTATWFHDQVAAPNIEVVVARRAAARGIPDDCDGLPQG